jgi:DNA-binding XRE family transcriptional regulator
MKTHKWATLRAQMRPESQREVQARVKRTLRHLDEIRKARGMTQVTLASSMGVTQAQITKVEHQADLYVSTLRRFIEAMGGELELVARFPDGEAMAMTLAAPPEKDARVLPKSTPARTRKVVRVKS